MNDNRPLFLLCTTKHTVAAITNTTAAIKTHGTTTEIMMIVPLFTEGALLPSPDSVVLATELVVALVVVPKLIVVGTCVPAVVIGVVRSVVDLDVVVCTSIVVVLSVVVGLSSVVPGIVVGKSVISGVV